MMFVHGLFLLMAFFVPQFIPTLLYAGEQKEYQEIVMLNWPEYMDFNLVKKFEEETGIHFRMVLFETDETRDELLAQTNSEGYDLMQVTCDRVNGYVQQGWLAPVNTTLVPNMKYIGKRWLEEFPSIIHHSVPFHWGTLGIAYRPDLLKTTMTRWRDLLVPVPSLHQKILMEKDSRNLVGMALKANGYSWNDHSMKAVQTATATLLAQRPHVKTYGYPSMDARSGLVTGDIWAATLYNGDAISLQEFEPRITYVVPEEGALLWMDCLAVLASSKRKQQAYDFINFLHEPRHAAQIANTLHYTPTNEAALPFLPPEFFKDPVINPPADLLNRSEFFTEKWPVRIERNYKILLNSLISQEAGSGLQ
ncbi:MAG: spermidine/putrescine ABC transporter substrate-binding protein [Magnetococcales bacterium]|nr:spermidine/putrescine ABC transporter substrate-binding protein [Magnetococcales bacterium]MBF0151208.1 spermidine/putrescine ABC transporter substrate-binding protein [Magnetococcales bacterium]